MTIVETIGTRRRRKRSRSGDHRRREHRARRGRGDTGRGEDQPVHAGDRRRPQQCLYRCITKSAVEMVGGLGREANATDGLRRLFLFIFLLYIFCTEFYVVYFVALVGRYVGGLLVSGGALLVTNDTRSTACREGCTAGRVSDLLAGGGAFSAALPRPRGRPYCYLASRRSVDRYTDTNGGRRRSGINTTIRPSKSVSQ